MRRWSVGPFSSLGNMRLLAVSVVTCAIAGAAGSVADMQSVASPGTPAMVTQAEYQRWKVELSNWGRWGKDDELGALNLITPAKRRAAAALVREGLSVSLASVAQTQKAVDAPCPNEWAMLSASEAGAADRIAYPCIHGAGTTHVDAFAHRFIDGKMWNGYPVAGLVTSEGAARNSVLNLKDGIVTRGALYDIPRLKGVPYLEPGTRFFRRISRPGNERLEYGSALAMRFCCAGGAGRDGRPWGPGRIRPPRGSICRCFRG